MANLLLARSLSRQRELATRIALGAGRARLLLQAITESAVFSVLGALPGCALACGLLKLFQFLAPLSVPRLQQATLDIRVLSFTLAITTVAAIAFGLAPSFSIFGNRHKHLLMTAQVAVSLTLLTAAGLLVESLWSLRNVNTGIGIEHVVTADITVGPAHYPNAQSRQQYFETLAARLRRMPGIRAVALSDTVPPTALFIRNRSPPCK